MQLYIIRHAQSYNNALTDVRERVAEPPLTALGHQQAQAVADYLASGLSLERQIRTHDELTGFNQQQGFNITKLYCSAMYRALQTARPIGEALGLNPEVWVGIHEHGGIHLQQDGEVVGYPGKTRSEILAEFPHYQLPDEVTEEGWWHMRSEDWPDCQARAIRTANKLREWAASEEYQHETIALITHGGFMDVLIKAILYQLPTRHAYFHLYNTAISRIDFVPMRSHVNVWYINRIDHLTPELLA